MTAEGRSRAVYRWRGLQRRRMVSIRVQTIDEERARATVAIENGLRDLLEPRHGDAVGLYWPIRGEVDLRAFARSDLAAAFAMGLPYVQARNAPVHFRRWSPRAPMIRGFWNIPVPQDETLITPTILLIPLVGFDSDGYRLGNGGGYYDRTLAAAAPTPLKVGVGFERTRLRTIHPQWHDIPMDCIVTEAGTRWYETA